MSDFGDVPCVAEIAQFRGMLTLSKSIASDLSGNGSKTVIR